MPQTPYIRPQSSHVNLISRDPSHHTIIGFSPGPSHHTSIWFCTDPGHRTLIWFSTDSSHHTLIWLSTDPPPQAPVITRSPSSHPLYSTDDLTLTCEVTGGKPLVTSVSLSCSSRHPDNPNDVTGSDSVSSSLQMTLTDDDDGITCSCIAVWKVTSFYTLSDSTTFTVYCELFVFYKYIL